MEFYLYKYIFQTPHNPQNVNFFDFFQIFKQNLENRLE